MTYSAVVEIEPLAFLLCARRPFGILILGKMRERCGPAADRLIVVVRLVPPLRLLIEEIGDVPFGGRGIQKIAVNLRTAGLT